MNDFNFKIPQDIIFGKGSLSRLPEVLKEYMTTYQKGYSETTNTTSMTR